MNLVRASDQHHGQDQATFVIISENIGEEEVEERGKSKWYLFIPI